MHLPLTLLVLAATQQRYVNEDYDFELAPPAGWERVTLRGPQGAVLARWRMPGGDPANPTEIAVRRVPSKWPTPLAELKASVREFLRSNYQDVKELPVRDALTYLATTFEAPFPRAAIESLDASHVSIRESVGYRLAPRNGDSRFGRPSMLAGHFLRWSAGLNVAHAAVSFPRYAQSRWGLGHRWEVPLAALSRCRNRGQPSGEL